MTTFQYDSDRRIQIQFELVLFLLELHDFLWVWSSPRVMVLSHLIVYCKIFYFCIWFRCYGFVQNQYFHLSLVTVDTF